MMKNNLSNAAAALGKKGGSVRSKKKAEAVRLNGRKGGRPSKRKCLQALARAIRERGVNDVLRVGGYDNDGTPNRQADQG